MWDLAPTAPFILLSGIAGPVAVRYNTRTVWF